MPDPVTSAFVILVAIAYLGGAVLMIAALAKVLLVRAAGRRRRNHLGQVDEYLRQQAAAAMAAVAARANVAPPAIDVVAILGVPAAGDAARTVGDGGLAVTASGPTGPRPWCSRRAR